MKLHLFLASAFLLVHCTPLSESAAADPEATLAMGEFWQHWGDGKAEIAAYDLQHPRYGELRKGLAISIFVTENFSISKGVKTERPHQGSADVVPVVKLNLVEDFSTGVYDYNLMTSVFSSLEPSASRAAGAPVKISFSSQEWCGHVYQQFRFGESTISSDSHSYFEGEEDAKTSFTYPKNGIAEDTLWHWARGFSAPFMSPGEQHKAPLLSSLKTLRLKHVEPTWQQAQFSYSDKPSKLSVPAGEFDVETRIVALANGSTIKFFVEVDKPKRIIKWETSEGISAELIGSKRLPYWSLKDIKSEELLKTIGVSPRPARTS